MRRGIEGANFFGYSLAHYYVFGRHRPAVTNVWDEFQQRRAEHGYDPEAAIAASANQERLGAKVVQQGIGGLRGAVGTPDQLRDYLRRYEECGVDQVIFCFQAGKNRHDHIMEALELFGRQVLPEFKDRDEKQASDKRARLAPVIDAVMARKPADDHPPLPADEYAFPAIPRAMADRNGSDEFEQLAALSDELDRLEADLPRIYAAGDRRASRDAGRRHQELKPVVEAYDEWKRLSQDVEDAHELLGSLTDPGERESWRVELADREAQLAAL